MKRKKALLWISVLIVAFLAMVGAWLYRSVSDIETHRRTIVAALSRTLNRSVEYKAASWSFHRGLAVAFDAVVIRERDGIGVFLSANRAFFRLALKPLLSGNLVFQDMSLEAPRIALRRDAQGGWNFSDLVAPEGKRSWAIDRLTISDGQISLNDALIASPAPLAFSGVSAEIAGDAPDGALVLGLSARSDAAGVQGTVAVKGKIGLGAENTVDLYVSLTDMALAPWRPYLADGKNLPGLEGVLSGQAVVKGSATRWTSSGKLTVAKGGLDMPRLFAERLNPAAASLEWEAERNGPDLVLRQARLAADDLRLSLSGTVGAMSSKDPQLNLRLSSDDFQLSRSGRYIPWPLFPDAVSLYLRRHVQDGRFRLEEARFTGAVSEFRRIGAPGSERLIAARLRVDGGRMDYGQGMPRLHDIQGAISFAGPDVVFSGMRGLIGASPATLNGVIRDYCLAAAPTRYEFALAAAPSREEIGSLLGKAVAVGFPAAGNGLLRLKGEGPAADYRLDGVWDLAATAYTVGDFAKPPAQESLLRFSARLRDGGMTVFPLRFDSAPWRLSGKILWQYAAPSRLTLDLSGDTADLAAATRNFPAWRPWTLRGGLRFALRGERHEKTRDWSWSGSAHLDRVGGSIPQTVHRFDNLEGTLVLGGGGRRWSFDALKAEAHGGRLTATGTVETLADRRTRYDIHLAAANLSGATLSSRRDGSGPLLTGRVNGKLHAIASGATWSEALRTLQGEGNLRIDGGVIQKFTLMSKVLSLLNLSAVLKLQFPDLTTAGMPYDRIAASFKGRNGILTTQDASLQSPSMNMAVVGDVNLAEETLNLQIGVQPLQTVDRLLGRVPVLGWLLMDQDKRLVMFYYRASGPWKNPSVESKPVRDLTREVFGIFRRVLQLPGKLVTDTGEVL